MDEDAGGRSSSSGTSKSGSSATTSVGLSGLDLAAGMGSPYKQCEKMRITQ